ncbi:hypothetical protein [Streptomyces virginiae]|uniref:hypothetical protein n=1 Tax=Streptomyces virginiae TaxID=1961 RepID=UPI00386DB354
MSGNAPALALGSGEEDERGQAAAQGGDPLYTIVLVRMRHDQRTRDYVARRTTEGMSTKDIMRCLKRFVAREVYRHLRSTDILNTVGSGGAGS